MNKTSAILLIHCTDKKGIVAKVTHFLNSNGGNIINLEQHVDKEANRFFMRIEWELEEFIIPNDKIAEYFETLIGSIYNMEFNLNFSNYRPRMAVFVSKMTHCLYDLLARAEEWEVDIPVIISNHYEAKDVANHFNIPFEYVPSVVGTDKSSMEQVQLEILKKYKPDFLVLARYMQILSDSFITTFGKAIINIHHSFLPAFIGAKPYHAAHARGVKIIGATCHYVTADLDAGPIIAQDIAHISHKDLVEDLVRKGKDLEKLVLSRGVWLHLQRKILSFNNKTIVFD